MNGKNRIKHLMGDGDKLVVHGSWFKDKGSRIKDKGCFDRLSTNGL
jgi:hypothetical protein